MSKLTSSNVTVADGVVRFDARIQGGIKEKLVRPAWSYDKLDLTLTHCRVDLETLLEGYLVSNRFWIGIQAKLRKCSGTFVGSLIGRTMGWASFDAMLEAALPESERTGKAELKAEISAKDREIEKLTEMLRKSGLTDEQIAVALKS